MFRKLWNPREYLLRSNETNMTDCQMLILNGRIRGETPTLNTLSQWVRSMSVFEGTPRKQYLNVAHFPLGLSSYSVIHPVRETTAFLDRKIVENSLVEGNDRLC